MSRTIELKAQLKKDLNITASFNIDRCSINPDVEIYNDYGVGEIFDVGCVALGLKQVAALDFSAYGKRKLRKLDKARINRILQNSADMGIQAIHNNKGSTYLKTIFFMPKNLKSAVALAIILWAKKEPIHSMFYGVLYDVALGILFGYPKRNIFCFIDKNYPNEYDQSRKTNIYISCKKFIDAIKAMIFQIDDLYKYIDDKIIILDKSSMVINVPAYSKTKHSR